VATPKADAARLSTETPTYETIRELAANWHGEETIRRLQNQIPIEFPQLDEGISELARNTKDLIEQFPTPSLTERCLLSQLKISTARLLDLLLALHLRVDQPLERDEARDYAQAQRDYFRVVNTLQRRLDRRESNAHPTPAQQAARLKSDPEYRGDCSPERSSEQPSTLNTLKESETQPAAKEIRAGQPPDLAPPQESQGFQELRFVEPLATANNRLVAFLDTRPVPLDLLECELRPRDHSRGRKSAQIPSG
jgi:hypothetical protein